MEVEAEVEEAEEVVVVVLRRVGEEVEVAAAEAVEAAEVTMTLPKTARCLPYTHSNQCRLGGCIHTCRCHRRSRHTHFPVSSVDHTPVLQVVVEEGEGLHQFHSRNCSRIGWDRGHIRR